MINFVLTLSKKTYQMKDKLQKREWSTLPFNWMKKGRSMLTVTKVNSKTKMHFELEWYRRQGSLHLPPRNGNWQLSKLDQGPVHVSPDKFLHGQKLARIPLAFTRDRRNFWAAKCASLGPSFFSRLPNLHTFKTFKNSSSLVDTV